MIPKFNILVYIIRLNSIHTETCFDKKIKATVIYARINRGNQTPRKSLNIYIYIYKVSQKCLHKLNDLRNVAH